MGNGRAARPGGRWQLWTVVLSGGVAFAASGLLAIADGLAGVMASWDTPAPGIVWIKAGIAGHCVLAAASIVVLGLGMRPASRHRGEAIAAWMIIGLGIGWFLLVGRLVSGG